MTITADRTITLANLANVGQPDSPDSPGARFLNRVADAVEDAIERDETDERALDEIANDSTADNTVGIWKEFVDLGGWNVDTTDLTGDRISASRITDHAQAVLFLIAERLIAALMEEHNNRISKLAALMAEPSPWTEGE